MSVPPDTKDWTFVITDGCSECGFVPIDAQRTGDRIRASVPLWRERLARPDARVRPEPQVWSPVEYGAHVRDVCRVFSQRLALMLSQDDPLFENWDQDAAAIEGRYSQADPEVVAREYAEAGGRLADAFDDVPESAWDRSGTRSNGSIFTVRTLAVYFLHDLEHHGMDVRLAR